MTEGGRKPGGHCQGKKPLTAAEKQRNYRERKKTMANRLSIKQLYGFSSTLTEKQQFVVGDEDGGVLHLITGEWPPQLWPVSSKFAKFKVFVISNAEDMQALAGIWNHSSVHHGQILKLYTLKDLGVCIQGEGKNHGN
jgi:hypothetical protein